MDGFFFFFHLISFINAKAHRTNPPLQKNNEAQTHKATFKDTWAKTQSPLTKKPTKRYPYPRVEIWTG